MQVQGSVVITCLTRLNDPLDELGVEALLAIVLRTRGRIFLRGELPRRLADQPLAVGELEVDPGRPCGLEGLGAAGTASSAAARAWRLSATDLAACRP
jgi:hypothetical protein